MDRLFVTNIEDKEVLYESARDRENVRSDPQNNGGAHFVSPSKGGQPSSEISDRNA